MAFNVLLCSIVTTYQAQVERAEATITASPIMTAESIEAHYQKGLGYVNLEQWQKAKSELETVFEFDPDYKDVQTHLKLVYEWLSTGEPVPDEPVSPDLSMSSSGEFFESCEAVLTAGLAKGDGVYWIDPDGSGGSPPFELYCDMTTDGGGWALLSSRIDNSQGNNQLSAFQKNRCKDPYETCYGYVSLAQDFTAIRIKNQELSVVIIGRNWREAFRKHLAGENPCTDWDCAHGDTPWFSNGTMFNDVQDIEAIVVNGETRETGRDARRFNMTTVRQTEHSQNHYITLAGRINTLYFQSYYGLHPESAPVFIEDPSGNYQYEGIGKSALSVWYR
jgi:hypothetical protein